MPPAAPFHASQNRRHRLKATRSRPGGDRGIAFLQIAKQIVIITVAEDQRAPEKMLIA
jgi:hypothetical protein